MPTPPSAIDTAIANIQALPDAADSNGDASGGTQADTQDPVLQAFYGPGGAPGQSPAPQVGPAPTGSTGLEWAKRGWAVPGSPADSTTTTGKVAASVATKGVTDAGLKRSHGVFDQANDRADAQLAKFGVEENQEKADSAGHYLEGAEGIRAAGIEEKQHAEALVKLSDQQASLQKAWAEQEQNIQGQAKAHGQAILDQYQNQLAGVAHLAQSSGNPIDDLSRTQALGLAGAQFVQGFLATRGININVTGQVDKLVENGMKAHQQLIENARQGAADTMHLYEVARQSSQDDNEARAKYRGMIVAGLQSQVTSEAARYQASTAMSSAAQRVAALQIDGDKVKREIGARAEQRYYQIHSEENKRAHDELQAAIESDKASIERLKIKAASAKAPPETKYFYDPTTHKAIGKITKGALGDAEHDKAATEATAGYDKLKSLQTRAVSLYRTAGEQGLLGGKATSIMNPEFRELKNTLNEIAMIRTKINNGTRSSDQEFDRQLDLFPVNKEYQAGNNDNIVSNFQEDNRRDYETTMAAHTSRLSKEEGAQTDPYITADPNLKTAGEVEKNAPDYVPTAADRRYAIAGETKDTEPKEADIKADEADPNFEHHDPHTTRVMSSAWVKAKGAGYHDFELRQPGWAVSLDVTAHLAAEGDKEAEQSLQHIAAGAGKAAGFSSIHIKYAKELAAQLAANPKSLVQELTSRIHGVNMTSEQSAEQERLVDDDMGTKYDTAF